MNSPRQLRVLPDQVKRRGDRHHRNELGLTDALGCPYGIFDGPTRPMPYSAIDQSNKYWTAGEEVTTLDAEQTNTEQRVRPRLF
jgi:hypothetical protein